MYLLVQIDIAHVGWNKIEISFESGDRLGQWSWDIGQCFFEQGVLFVVVLGDGAIVLTCNILAIHVLQSYIIGPLQFLIILHYICGRYSYYKLTSLFAHIIQYAEYQFIIKIINQQTNIRPMLQTATINYNSPTHAALANLHPCNAANVNGRIISRSPTAVHLGDHRNLSPNKLNATKKPLVGQNQNLNTNLPNIANFVRGRAGQSPTAKLGNFGFNIPNVANGYHNYNTNTLFSNTNRQPLLNSNEYGTKNQYQLPNHSNRANFCQNHPNKPAEFYTSTDNQQNFYCQKCAINLASKGFAVTKISERPQPRQQAQNNIFESHRLKEFCNQAQYVDSPEYSQIQKLISTIDNVHHSYLSQIHKYQNIDQHYQHQYELTQNFYEDLLDLVQQMKNDHLNDLKNQAKKHSQHALIKQDHLKSDLEQMEIIRTDVINSVEVILNRFNDHLVQEAFGFYKQQLFQYKDKIEDECLEFSKIVINQKESQLKNRLKKIEDYLLNVWNQKNQARQQQNHVNRPPINPIPQPNTYRAPTDQRIVNQAANHLVQDKSPKSVKHLLNLNTNQPVEANRPSACRQLFEDDNENFDEGEENEKNHQFNQNDFDFQSHEELAGQKSPQFKNI